MVNRDFNKVRLPLLTHAWPFLVYIVNFVSIFLSIIMFLDKLFYEATFSLGSRRSEYLFPLLLFGL